MKVYDLMRIILAVLALFFLKDILVQVPPTVLSFSWIVDGQSIGSIILILFYTVFTLFFYGLIVYFLLFRADYVIRKLRLTDNYSTDRIDFSLHRSTVLSLAIIIVGGLLVVQVLPVLVNYVIQYYGESKRLSGVGNNSYAGIIVSLVQLLLGLILLGNHRLFVNLIERARRKESVEIASASEQSVS